jgi:zinc transport system substrate-binding protein
MKWLSYQVCGLCLSALALLVGGCGRPASGARSPLVAVSNSYLESAVHDLLGDGVPVLCLAEPGTCPGHFDLRPSQIEALRRCRLLVRFDFQSSLDLKLDTAAGGGVRVAAVSIDGGMCEPASYLQACRQVGGALAEMGMIDRVSADQRLAEIDRRLAAETNALRRQITQAGLDGCAVVSSRHQAAFCRFLGLEVVGTFSGADTASVREIDSAIRNGRATQGVATAPVHAPALVVANIPEGRGLADALGQRLGVPVVVLANFPDQRDHHGRFDEMLRDNVRRLTDHTSP